MIDGRKIKVLREEKGMRRDACAVKAGISVSGLMEIEEGRTIGPRITTLAAIARALEIDEDTFWDRINVKTEGKGDEG